MTRTVSDLLSDSHLRTIPLAAVWREDKRTARREAGRQRGAVAILQVTSGGNLD